MLVEEVVLRHPRVNEIDEALGSGSQQEVLKRE